MSNASTAITPSGEAPRSRAVALPDKITQAIELRRQQNSVAAAIAATTWGQNLDQTQRRAIVEYGRRHGIDPVREIDVLGGRIYLNANYYQRRLAELMGVGLIVAFNLDHIEADERLTEMAAEPDGQDDESRDWARSELRRRLRLRIAHAIPESAISAVVCSVEVRGVKYPITAAKWAGGKGQVQQKKRDGTSYMRDMDPIGDAMPVETAESRAIRRCLRLAISHVPEHGDALEAMVLDAEDVTEAITLTPEEPQPRRNVKPVLVDNVYDEDPPQKSAVEPNVEPRVGEQEPTDEELEMEMRAPLETDV